MLHLISFFLFLASNGVVLGDETLLTLFDECGKWWAEEDVIAMKQCS